MSYILSIDQGTSSTRAILFNATGQVEALSQLSIEQSYPQDGWVEHDAEEIWQKTERTIKDVVAKGEIEAADIVSAGITNQRETTVVWHKETGEVLAPAIVWQDRRTAEDCANKKELADDIEARSGLVLDAYFSASKLAWLLNHHSEAKRLADKNLLCFGTIDSFLIWRLTNGQVHATDITNASRTMLFNINEVCWDSTLLKYFDIPDSVLPEVRASDAFYGEMDKSILGKSIPITGVAGDQQAATVGQACFEPGMAKVTFGTGAFLLLNTGEERAHSKHQLLSTVAYQIKDKVIYGLEGSVFNAGTIIKWLRDELALIKEAKDSESIAESLTDNGGVYLVPAFTGLGAPYWASNVRAAILGMKLDTKSTHIVRAALESVAYQTKDILQAMQEDIGRDLTEVRVDGGMVTNAWLMQFIASLCGLTVNKPRCIESTARGAAMLSGLGSGFFNSLDEVGALWQLDESYKPRPSSGFTTSYQHWRQAIQNLCAYDFVT